MRNFSLKAFSQRMQCHIALPNRNSQILTTILPLLKEYLSSQELILLLSSNRALLKAKVDKVDLLDVELTMDQVNNFFFTSEERKISSLTVEMRNLNLELPTFLLPYLTKLRLHQTEGELELGEIFSFPFADDMGSSEGGYLFTNLSQVTKCTNLTYLDIDVFYLKDFDFLIKMQKLKYLCLTDFYGGLDYKLISKCASLQTLKIDCRKGPKSLAPFETLSNLESLTIKSWRSLDNIRLPSTFIHKCPKIREVILNRRSLLKILSLSNNTLKKINEYEKEELSQEEKQILPIKRKIKIRGKSSDKTSFSDLHNYPLVEELFISGENTGLRSSIILNKPRFLNLRQLTLFGTKFLTDLSFFGFSPNLEKVTIDIPDLTSLSGLENKPHLEEIRLDNTPKLIDLSALKGCYNLKRIRVNSKQITHLHFVIYCPLLRLIDARGCKKLQDIDAIRYCPKLEGLSLEGTNVTNLDVLEDCPRLKLVNLEHTKLSLERVQEQYPDIIFMKDDQSDEENEGDDY